MGAPSSNAATPQDMGQRGPVFTVVEFHWRFTPYYWISPSPLLLHSYNSQPGVGVRVPVPVRTVAQFRPDEKEWRMTVLCTVRCVCVCVVVRYAAGRLHGAPELGRGPVWSPQRCHGTFKYNSLRVCGCLRMCPVCSCVRAHEGATATTVIRGRRRRRAQSSKCRALPSLCGGADRSGI